MSINNLTTKGNVQAVCSLLHATLMSTFSTVYQARLLWASSCKVSLGSAASLVKHNNSPGGRNNRESSLGSDLQTVLHLASRWVNLGHSEERAHPSCVPRGQPPLLLLIVPPQHHNHIRKSDIQHVIGIRENPRQQGVQVSFKDLASS